MTPELVWSFAAGVIDGMPLAAWVFMGLALVCALAPVPGIKGSKEDDSY